jgi:hypothetical protein
LAKRKAITAKKARRSSASGRQCAPALDESQADRVTDFAVLAAESIPQPSDSKIRETASSSTRLTVPSKEVAAIGLPKGGTQARFC